MSGGPRAFGSGAISAKRVFERTVAEAVRRTKLAFQNPSSTTTDPAGLALGVRSYAPPQGLVPASYILPGVFGPGSFVVGDGTPLPITPNRLSNYLALIGNSVRPALALYGAGALPAALFTYGAGGTISSPSALAAGAQILSINARGYDGAAWSTQNSASIALSAAENWTNAAHGGNILFSVTPTGAVTAAALVWVIDADGSLHTATDPGGTQLLRVQGGAVFQNTTGAALLTLSRQSVGSHVASIDGAGTFFLTANGGAQIGLTQSNVFVSNALQTGAPNGGTAGVWKLGIQVAGAGQTLNTGQYLQVDIGGTLYKLATVN